MNIPDLKSTKIKEETRLGLYVWEMPDGRWIGDDEGNFLSITSMKGDKSRMAALAEAVKGYGIDTGQPLFLSGRRKVNDEEFAYQQQRLKWGMVPDPYDIGNYKDEMAALKKSGGAK